MDKTDMTMDKEQIIEEKTEEIKSLQKLLDDNSVELGRNVSLLQKINAMAKAINSETSFQSLLETILSEAKIIDGVEKACALIYEKLTGRFAFKASWGWEPKRFESLSLSRKEAIARYCSNGKEIYEGFYVIKDFAGRAGEKQLVDFETPAALLVMQLRVDESIDGFLVFDSLQNPNAFDNLDLWLLKNMKDHILSAYLKTKLLEDLRNLNERKNEIIGIVAHDLRNPVASTIGFTRMILQNIETGKFTFESIKPDLEAILTSNLQMNEFITDLLNISAIESGKIKLEMYEEDLTHILEECCFQSEYLAKKKEITISLKASSSGSKVLADRIKINEVVNNLLSNAIKYTNKGGRGRGFE